VAIAPEVPVAGKELVVSFSIDGGKPPFTYSLEILDDSGRIGDEIQVITSERHIEQAVPLVDVDADKNLGIRVKVTDNDLHDTEHHKPAGSWVRTAAAPQDSPVGADDEADATKAADAAAKKAADEAAKKAADDAAKKAADDAAKKAADDAAKKTADDAAKK
jgi:hypothetical protein